jgi:hypothetical protein
MQSSSIIIVILLNYGNWLLPISLLLVSFGMFLRYFRNFNNSISNKQESDSSSFKCISSLLISIQNTKKNIENSRHKIGLLTNLWKIGIILLICQLFNPNFKLNISYLETETPYLDRIVYILPFLVQLISSLTLYLASSLAFKLRMSRFSFAFPLTLVTPISIALLLIIKSIGIVPYWLEYVRYFISYSESLASYKIHIIYGLALWWISHLWISSHIWNNENSSKETTIKRYVCFII